MWKKLVSKGKGIQVAYLNLHALQLYKRGKHEQALDYARKAYGLAGHYLREEHPLSISCLANLAMLHRAMGHYSQAAQFLERELAIKRAILGEQHPDVAESLNNLAVLYQEMGNYGQAESLMQQALEMTRDASGETHFDVAVCLDNLASLYTSMGEYTQAERLYRQALDMKRSIFGEQDPEIATSLNNLALLYRQTGNYTQAKLLLQQALIISSSALGATHPKVSISLNNLAELYCAVGDYSQAEPLLQQALALSRTVSGETHPDTARSLNNLAGLYNALGNYVEAEPLLRQALAIRRSALGEQHPDVAQGLNNLAVLYAKIGSYAQAESLFRQALVITHAGLGEQHPEVATSLNNLAELYRMWGQYDKAEPLLSQALNIQRTSLGENHLDIAHSLNNLALLYESMGDNAKARQCHQQALTIRRTVLGEKHPDVSQSLNNLAVLFQASGDYTQAQKLYQQALDIKRASLGEAHPSFATGLHNLAALYELMGNNTKAEQLYQRALELRRQILGEEHPDVATSLNNLAALYESIGDSTQAEHFYQQALTIRRTALGEIHPDIAQSLNNLALLYAATHRETESLALLQQLSVIQDKMIGQIFAIGSERQRLEFLKTLQGATDIFLSLILQHFRHSPEVVQTGLNLVLRRKGIAADVLAAQRDALLSGRYPTLAPKLHELTLLRAQIAQKTLAGPGLEGPEAQRQLLRDWNDRRELLEVELARQIPEMNLTQGLQRVDRQTLVKALLPATALVEFVRCRTFDFQEVPTRSKARWKGERYLAFVLSADQPAGGQMVDLGEADPTDLQVATFRFAVTGEGEGGKLRHLKSGSAYHAQVVDTHVGVALRKAIFDPLLPPIGGRSRLFLAPDGDLSRLPFGILPTDDGRYLIDDYLISYLSTGRDIIRFEYVPFEQASPPLVIANPDFDLCGDRIPPEPTLTEQYEEQPNSLNDHTRLFESLPGTQMEGEQVAALLGVEPLLRERALEATLKAHHSPYILHIATHGFFFPDQQQTPDDEVLKTLTSHRSRGIGKLDQFLRRGTENPLLRSGLALTGANTWDRGGPLPAEAEDGILTAEDVSALDLSATGLVVLSACQTGLGEVRIGEGVFGLRRAFVIAGAKTLIMSLWKVPDLQTQELMVDFYQRFLAGHIKSCDILML
ncbi:MAG: tetratricopeptide repeat protein [Ktedonobacteraceae bacterium]